MRRNYLALWILLTTAFAIVVILSIFGPVTILGYELKDSGMSKIFWNDTIANVEISAVDSVVPFSADSIEAEKPVEVDTTKKTILFFGDSMLDGLYPRLAAYAEQNGHELYAVIWYSSTSETWGKSDKLRKYIEQLHPNYIFISLGANELFVKDIADKRDKYVKNIISDIGDIPYLWIGPPNWKPDTGINSLIERNAAKGSFFLSDGMTFIRKKDGAHPTSKSSEEWMDSIVRWMPQHSNHPILMEKPDKTKGKAKRVFVHQPDEK